MGSDPTTAAAVKTAQDSFASAKSAIGQIGEAIVTGQQAPAAARQQTADGLNAAAAALQSITGWVFMLRIYLQAISFYHSDSNATAALSSTQAAITAGGNVVSQCK
jgi:hypothetical protein